MHATYMNARGLLPLPGRIDFLIGFRWLTPPAKLWRASGSKTAASSLGEPIAVRVLNFPLAMAADEMEPSVGDDGSETNDSRCCRAGGSMEISRWRQPRDKDGSTIPPWKGGRPAAIWRPCRGGTLALLTGGLRHRLNSVGPPGRS